MSAHSGMSNIGNRLFQTGKEIRRRRIRLESGRDILQGKFETNKDEQKGAGRKNNFIGEKKRGELQQ